MISRLPLSSLIFAVALSAGPAFAQVAGTPNSPPPTNAMAAPAATPAPSPAAAPVATPDTSAPATTPEERPSSYTVVQGDSLWVIAHRFGTTVVKLRKANHLKKHALLHPGQVLQIPPATTDASAVK